MTASFVSWFSGVGMFDLALIRAGFERRGACEIDKFARKVYAARLGAPAFFSEDITSVEAQDIPDADVWIGGFPCQDVSVAGKRAGIGDGDTRSGLVHTFLRLAVAKRPRFLLLENVPGLLSGATDDGRGAGDVERDEMGEPAGDALWFGSLLGALAESGYRHGAWRILDARWFGVAQRRRRVFLLFARDPRDGAVARAVLSEPESVRRGPPTRGEARSRTAAGARGGLAGLGEQRVARSLGSVGGGQDPAVGKGDLIVAHETGQGWWTEGAGTLRAGANGGGVGAKTPLVFLDAWSTRGSSSPNQHPCKTDGLSDALDTTGPGAVFPTLRGFGHGWQGQQNDDASKAGMVRRLTPLECERLQGLPDGWTCLCGAAPYSTAACKCADGPRYRAIGNGGAVPVVEWIGRRLLVRIGGDPT